MGDGGWGRVASHTKPSLTCLNIKVPFAIHQRVPSWRRGWPGTGAAAAAAPDHGRCTKRARAAAGAGAGAGAKAGSEREEGELS